jgi:hypothetical protein
VPDNFLGLLQHGNQLAGVGGGVYYISSGNNHPLSRNQGRHHSLGVVSGHDALTSFHQLGILVGLVHSFLFLILSQLVQGRLHPPAQCLGIL